MTELMNGTAEPTTDVDTTCGTCGRVMATKATLSRHVARLHQADTVADVPVPRTPEASHMPAPATPASDSGYQVWAGAVAPARATPEKPLWKKKRFLIPASLVALFILIGAVSPSSKKSPAAQSTTVTQTAPELTAAQKAEADKAAAAKAAADKAAAAKAAADKAAADKLAAAKKAAAEKAAAAKAAAAKAAAETAGQENAREAAANYLAMTPFSRSGLIKQLEFEGYSTSDATYGTDSQHASWNTQAARAAENYLQMTAFSRSGLIEQLMFEGYTRSQATYGVGRAGL